MPVTGRLEKVESVSEGLKLTIYIKDEAQMDEAFRLRKKDVSLSLAGTGLTDEGVDMEVVRFLAIGALQQAIDSMCAPDIDIATEGSIEMSREEQLSLVGA